MKHRYSKSFALRGDIARGTPGSKPGVEVARLDVGELHCDMVIKVHRAVTMSRTIREYEEYKGQTGGRGFENP